MGCGPEGTAAGGGRGASWTVGGGGGSCRTSRGGAAQATPRMSRSRFIPALLTRFQDFAALHDEEDVLHRGHVLERVLLHRDEIGVLPRRDGADVARGADGRL